MTWLTSLSRRQHLWLALASVIGLLTVAVGVVREKATVHAPLVAFTADMSIRQIAPQFGVTGKSLARELGLPLDAPKNEPLTALGVTEEQLEHVAHHLAGHRESTLKYYLFVALVLFGLVFPVRLGRSDDSPAAQRART